MTTIECRYTIRYLQFGQPRKYADSIYEYEITSERKTKDGWVPINLDKESMIKVAQSIGRAWKKDPAWYEPTLKSISDLGNGTWRFKVIEAFTD